MANRLHERSAEIATIGDAVAALEGGRGSVVLIEARAGRGKSTLIEYAVAAAQEVGARILLARARHLEAAAPFEVLRRLLGPAVEEAGGAGGLTGAARFAAPLFVPGAEMPQGVDYGCQWLIARLAEQRPLVLAVDDAHWADAASLRVLLEVQAEISVQPVLLVLGCRPVENPDAQRRLATMAAQPDCLVLTPRLLSREAVAAVVSETFGESASETFVDDCLKVCGGNAFYLHELLRQYSDFRPDQQAFVRDGNMSLRRTMSWRLSELGPEATALAQAAAILGDGASLHLVASLAELDNVVAVEEAARLEAASIFKHGDPVDFVHPLVRAAVEKTLPEVMVGQLHARAAAMLRANGASASTVIQHLVAAPAAGDPDVARFLAEQGRAALESGSVTVARRVLKRALDEPIPIDDRDALLVSLARAEHAYGDLESAREHLAAPFESAERGVRLEAAAELFDVLVDAGHYDDLGAVHRLVVEMEPYGESDAEVRLRAQLLLNAVLGLEPDLAPLPAELSEIDATKIPTDRDSDRYLRAVAAVYERTMQRGTTVRLLENLRLVISTLPPDAGDYSEFDVWTALIVVTFLSDDGLDEIEAVMDRVAPAVVRLRGTMPAYQAELDHRRVMTRMARGEFEDALAQIDVTEEFVARHHLEGGFESAHRFARGWIAFERGDYEQGARLLSERIGEDNVYPALGALLAGRPERTVELLSAYELSSEPGAAVKQIEVELEPHLIASHAFEMLGDRARAEAEALREVDVRRRYGSRPRLALALRRRARFLPARASLPLLEEAVELADMTPRRPVQVRVLASYGATLRRTGSLDEARSVLYRVIEDAEQMGMERVRARAYSELVQAGGRPRRTRLSGPTSLTDSQRQVAELAASGRTNREIAEQLFVTIKTVETHLAAVFRKLEISRREELAPVLESSAGQPSTTPVLSGKG